MTDLRRLRALATLATACTLFAPRSSAFDQATTGLRSCPFDARNTAAVELHEKLKRLQDWRDRNRCTTDALGSNDAAVRAVALKGIADAYGLRLSGVEGGKDPGRTIEGIIAQATQILTSGNERERSQAGYLLGDLRSPAAVPALLGALADPDLGVKSVAVQALGQVRDKRAIRPLAALARGAAVGLDAIDALAVIGGPEAAEALAELANDRKVDISRREVAASHLRGMGDPRGAALYRKATDARRPEWRYVLLFPPVVYLFNWLSARSGPSRTRAWRVLTLVAAGAGMIFVNPVWLFSGMRDDSAVFAVLAIAFPVGTALVGAGLGGLVKLRAPELGEKMMGGMAVVPLVMWAALVLWIVVAFALMVIGLARSWG